MMLLAVSWVIVVRLVTWILCFPIGLCNMSRTRRSWAALQPYNGLPGATGAPARSPADDLATKFGYVWPFADLMCLCIGMMDRQGFFEFLTAVPLMIAVLPVYKHVILTNALLYDLKEVYINQWTDPLDANQDEAPIRDLMQRCICRALLEESNRDFIDAWIFAGYHQYPPPSRESKTVAGMQFANNGPLRAAMISHTTHPYDVPGHVIKSTDASFGFIVVRLQSWNPFYQLAGVVEVNYRKDGGIEHPMWLILDKNSKIAADACNNINAIFVELGFNFRRLLLAKLRKDKS
jgi:hypothetical protein